MVTSAERAPARASPDLNPRDNTRLAATGERNPQRLGGQGLETAISVASTRCKHANVQGQVRECQHAFPPRQGACSGNPRSPTGLAWVVGFAMAECVCS